MSIPDREAAIILGRPWEDEPTKQSKPEKKDG